MNWHDILAFASKQMERRERTKYQDFAAPIFWEDWDRIVAVVEAASECKKVYCQSFDGINGCEPQYSLWKALAELGV